jgi:hypothetical protein
VNKKLVVISIFVATSQNQNCFIFELVKKNFWANLQISTQKYGFGVWDSGSGSEIRDLEKSYSGSRNQKGTGYRIRNKDPDPDLSFRMDPHWFCRSATPVNSTLISQMATPSLCSTRSFMFPRPGENLNCKMLPRPGK